MTQSPFVQLTQRLWQDFQLQNRVAVLLGVAGSLLVLSAAAAWLMQRPMFAVKTVEIRATSGSELRYVERSSLVAQGLFSKSANGLFSQLSGSLFKVDVQAMRERIEKAPWVRHASVRRVWPNRLLVQIEEHQVAGLWADGRLVNSYGELFSANAAQAQEGARLPQLSGPNGSEAEVLKRWQELNEWLMPLNAKAVQLSLSQRYAWTAKLDNGLNLILGREQGVALADRVKKMVESLPSANSRMGAQSEVVDLRYPNGYAVKSSATRTN
jgi:cell division protein FtsQ